VRTVRIPTVGLNAVPTAAITLTLATPRPLPTASPTTTATPRPTHTATAAPTPTATIPLEPTATPRPPVIDTTTLTATLVSGQLRLQGTGQPTTTLQILLDGELVGVTTVDATGRWQLPLLLEQPGAHQIQVRPLGLTGVPTAAVDLVIATPTATTPPRSTEPADETATHTPEPTATATPTLIPPIIDTTALTGPLPSGAVRLQGKGEPGAALQILVDGELAGVTTVDGDGRWQLPVFVDQPGDHQISVRAAGVSLTAVIAIVIATPTATVTAPPEPTATATNTPTPTATATAVPTATPLPPTPIPPSLDTSAFSATFPVVC